MTAQDTYRIKKTGTHRRRLDFLVSRFGKGAHLGVFLEAFRKCSYLGNCVLYTLTASV